jgi:hypothetical protein
MVGGAHPTAVAQTLAPCRKRAARVVVTTNKIGSSIAAAAFEKADEVVGREVVRDGDAMLLGELDDGPVQGVDLGSSCRP